MMGGHELTLWPACVRTHALAEQIAATAMAGYSSLAINPATYHVAISSGLSPRDILRIADEHHVRFKWVDAVSGWLPIRYPANAELEGLSGFRSGLGIRNRRRAWRRSNTGHWMLPGRRACAGAAGGCFDALCRRAESRKLQIGLEFIPTWGIRDLESAWRIASAVDAPNGGYVIDTWHFFRSSSDPELLKRIPDDKIFAVQIADAPRDYSGRTLLDDCLNFRRLPGEGELPLLPLLDLIGKKGVLDFGPEVFSAELDRLRARQAAMLCADATRALLETGRSSGAGVRQAG